MTDYVQYFCNSCWVQGIQVHEATEFRQTYVQLAPDRTLLEDTLVELRCYRGTSENPQWLDIEAGEFLSGLQDIMRAEPQIRYVSDDMLHWSKYLANKQKYTSTPIARSRESLLRFRIRSHSIIRTD